MMVTNIKEITSDRWEIQLNGDPWLTYYKGDLSKDPEVGDILNIRPPKIVGYAIAPEIVTKSAQNRK